MPSPRAPSPGSLGAVEIVGLVQEHAEVERGVGVAAPLGALVGCLRTLDVAALMEHDPKVESATGVSGRVESAEFLLLDIGHRAGRNGRPIPCPFRTSRGRVGGNAGVAERRHSRTEVAPGRGLRDRGPVPCGGASGTRRWQRR